jgi:uncharacterized protein YkwD
VRFLFVLLAAGCGDDGGGGGDADTDVDTDADTDTSTDTDTGTGSDPNACDGLAVTDDQLAEEDAFFALLAAARASGTTCGGTEVPAVGALAMNAAIRCASREHVIDIESTGNVDHTGSDGSDYQDRFRRWGYFPTRWGGDVLDEAHAAEDAFSAWMGRAHCEELAMDDGYEDFGVATLDGYWVAGYGSTE